MSTRENLSFPLSIQKNKEAENRQMKKINLPLRVLSLKFYAGKNLHAANQLGGFFLLPCFLLQKENQF